MPALGGSLRAARSRSACFYCGAAFGADPSPVKGLCGPCSARVLAGTGSSSPETASETRDAREVAMIRAARSYEALAELVEAKPDPLRPVLLDELFVIDKQLSWFVTLIPFVGPWLVQRSDTLGASEKRRLTWLSAALTAVVLALAVGMVPGPARRIDGLHRRIDADMRELGDLARRHRAEHGAFPEQATWQLYAARADPRFFDPWGRPYRYASTETGLTLRTLGRDGVPGGSGEDTDVSVYVDAVAPERRDPSP